MHIKTYRAASMHEALELVRRDLGAEASVLHTREVQTRGLKRLLLRRREIEITASPDANVPSRLPPARNTASEVAASAQGLPAAHAAQHEPPVPAHLEHDFRARFRDSLKSQADDLQSMVEQLCASGRSGRGQDMSASLFTVFTDMIEAAVDEDVARELIEDVRRNQGAKEWEDADSVKVRIAALLEARIAEHGPIRTERGRRRLAALVGPTGVGKTTTIAKLAANFRLREKLRVGLITVDTYRIAAVEQLRTYADIIDLPMEVVSSPREMREAAARMDHLDLVLLDTAGRSPRDEIKVQELKSVLAEAGADEVHLVLSAVSAARHLRATAEQFRGVGVTGLVLTKLDEAHGLGNLLPLLTKTGLPVSYLTHGQNVPDDITVADKRRLVSNILRI